MSDKPRRPKSGLELATLELVDDLRDLHALPARGVMREMLNDAIEYFGFKSSMKEHLEKHRISVQEDILSLYQVRNGILHDAHLDRTRLQYAVQRAERFALYWVWFLVNYLSSAKNLTVADALLYPYNAERRLLTTLGDLGLTNLERWPIKLSSWVLKKPKVIFSMPSSMLELVEPGDE
jgi:hypothetical protein